MALGSRDKPHARSGEHNRTTLGEEHQAVPWRCSHENDPIAPSLLEISDRRDRCRKSSRSDEDENSSVGGQLGWPSCKEFVGQLEISAGTVSFIEDDIRPAKPFPRCLRLKQ